MALTRVILTVAAISAANAFQDDCIKTDQDTLKCNPSRLALLSLDRTEDFKRLEVICNEQDGEAASVGDLWREHPGLESISLDSCRISKLTHDSFSHLPNLKILKLNKLSSSLEIEQGAFRGLTRLEVLDLSSNGLWTLPERLTCHLPSLTSLNVSYNHLTDASDSGISSQDCLAASLASLDLSGNFISTLRGGEFGRAPALRVLDLSANRMGLLQDGALDELSNLQVLDLSNNRLAAMPGSLFKSNSELRSMRLQNNSLTLLPEGIFAGLETLRSLNLSANSLESHLLEGQSFSGLDSLQTLDPSHNKLNKVTADLFRHLGDLSPLHLNGKGLQQVEPQSFIFNS